MELIWGLLIAACILVPLWLSIRNICDWFNKNTSGERIMKDASLTICIGGVLYFLMYGLAVDGGDWYERLYAFQLHYTVSTDYLPALVITAIVGLVGFSIILFGSAEKLPPLVSVFSIAAVIVVNVLQLAHAVQLARHFGVPVGFLYIYHANLVLISATVIRKHVREQLAVAKQKGMDESEKVKYRWIYSKMTSVSRYSLFVFIALLILIALLEIIFVLCGQGIDAPIKAFTNTADWTFSQQTPPPPKEYTGHYLCTVAASGHSNVVKPLRYGTRLGATIVVNRQLCVANAFEDLIKEKMPRFHKVVRGGYDKYGYPVSKHITTPLRADIVYFLMKPLEWIFLFVLYLFDKDPEKRISRQYEYRR